MLFYKAYIKSELNVGSFAPANPRPLYEELGQKICLYPTSLKEKSDRALELFCTNPEDRKERYTFGDNLDTNRYFEVIAVIIDENITKDELTLEIRKAVETWGFGVVRGIQVDECTAIEVGDKIRFSHLSDNRENWAARLHLVSLFEVLKAEDAFYESILGNPKKTKDILSDIKYNASREYSDSLLEELKRVCAGKKHSEALQSLKLPVHYVLEGNSSKQLNSVKKDLIDCLYEKGRVKSRLIFTYDIDKINNSIFYNHALVEYGAINNEIVEAISGHVIVINYGRFDRNEKYNRNLYEALTNFVTLLKPYLNNTQLIFVLPEGSSEIRRLLQNLFEVPLVLIKKNKETKVSLEARSMLIEQAECLATENGETLDDSFEAFLDECLEAGVFSDIKDIYSKWSFKKLIKTKYPQYQPFLETLESKRNSIGQSDALGELDSLIGLSSVKQSIHRVIDRAKMEKELERRGISHQNYSMHMVFSGSPGTGKTVVAKLFGQIMKDSGILKEGRVISISASSIKSMTNFSNIIESAYGSVLFIDEAYTLSLDAVAELIAQMENHRDELIVILAGYSRHMQALLGSNPGFKSRIGEEIYFPDYSEEELLEIFKYMVVHRGMTIDDKALSCARDIFARIGKAGDQGNARYVRQIFEKVESNQKIRLFNSFDDVSAIPDEELIKIDASDFNDVAPLAPLAQGTKDSAYYQKSSAEQLMELIGLSDVKKVILKRIDFMRAQKIQRDRGKSTSFVPAHMAFLGNPGTGKTEVANLLARILVEKNLLSVGKVIQVPAVSLVSVPPVIPSLFENARGSIIFIDEAYTLLSSPTAISSMVESMDRYKNEVVVIMAGYSEEMNELFHSNPGLMSRIRSQIDFPDYSDDELVQIFELMCLQREYQYDSEMLKLVKQFISIQDKDRYFGNARFVRNLVEEMMLNEGARTVRLCDSEGEDVISDESLKFFTKEDFEEACISIQQEVKRNKKLTLGFK